MDDGFNATPLVVVGAGANNQGSFTVLSQNRGQGTGVAHDGSLVETGDLVGREHVGGFANEGGSFAPARPQRQR